MLPVSANPSGAARARAPELPAQAFEQAAAGFETAAGAAGGAGELWFLLADELVRARIVGRELTRVLGAAFAHLRVTPARGAIPSLSLDLWDTAASRVANPVACPWDRAATADGRVAQRAVPFLSSWLDRRENRLIACCADAVRLAPSDRYRPLYAPLMLWLADCGILPAHAGAVGRGGSAVLIAGETGAGKSTVSLACALAGFDYLGDDIVAVTRGPGGGFLGHSLYGTAHVFDAHVRRFPGVTGPAVHRDASIEGKSIVEVGRLLPDRLARTASLAAIVLPRVAAAGPVRIHPATKAEAMLAMAPTSLLMRDGTPQAFHLAGALIDTVPAYWLELGGDVAAIAPALAPLLVAPRREDACWIDA